VSVGTGVSVGMGVAVTVRVAVGATVASEDGVAPVVASTGAVADTVWPGVGAVSTAVAAEGTAVIPPEEVGLSAATGVGDSGSAVKVGLGVRVALGVGIGGLERAHATSSANTNTRLANSNLLDTVLFLLQSTAMYTA